MRVEILMGFIFFRSYLLRLKKFHHFIIISSILNAIESAAFSYKLCDNGQNSD